MGERPPRRVARLAAASRPDFFRVHCDAAGTGWCYCTAWWVPTWEGFADRRDADNRALREALFARGEDDGYLLYEGGEPLAWAQVGPRDRLAKLVTQYELAPDPGAWAVSCLTVLPARRGEGLAKALVAGVLADLAARGATAVEAFPKPGDDLRPGEAWRGSERLFAGFGFREAKRVGGAAVMRRAVAPDVSA